MLSNAKRTEEDEMVNNDVETSQNGSDDADMNGDADCKPLKFNMPLSLNENAFDLKDDICDSKLNGDSDSNEWPSSSDSESARGTSYNSREARISNESSQRDVMDKTIDTNGSLNGDACVPNVPKPFTKKVRPLKICFGVKNSLNGVKRKNSKISNDTKVHYIEHADGTDDSGDLSEEPRQEPEYAQYLGIKPSVNFKCSRCGVKNFATMALLNEHQTSCDGQTPLTVALPACNGEETSTNLRITRKVFLCSSCGTYYQSYDLYIHMREVHTKQICLVCFNMFTRSQQLWDHLIGAHNLKLGEYQNVSQIRNAYKGSFYITCCTCNRLFNEDERFEEHDCGGSLTEEAPIAAETPVTSTITDKLPSDDAESAPESPLSPVRSHLSTPARAETPKCDISPEPPAEFVNEPERQPESPEPEPAPEPAPNEPVVETKSPIHEAEPPAEEIDPPLSPPPETLDTPEIPDAVSESPPPPPEAKPDKGDSSDSDSINALFDTSSNHVDEEPQPEPEEKNLPLPMALMLDEAVASLDTVTLIRECVKTSCTSCTYCRNAVMIAVNGRQLGMHLLSEHRYKPTKNEDGSEQVEQKIDSSLADLHDVYLNASSNEFDGTFVCFQCSYSTTLLKELCAHKRKAHQMHIHLCVVCKCNFHNYSELLCHECPGEYTSQSYSLRFRCCFCSLNHIASAFRLMIHIRKFHKSCNLCLSRYNDQYELFSHMTKQHKMPYTCYKCDLSYRSRNDIGNHLFWKHGTESVLCQRCLQKKWPHAYHFCIPATTYTCEECNRVFTKAVALTVHRRAHNGEFPFVCETCDQRCISKRLLAAHRRLVHPELVKDETPPEPEPTQDGNVDQHSDDANGDKKKRKKKRKKVKVSEKPLLDELPPLNLSSESDDESAPDAEDVSASKPEIASSPKSSHSPPSSPKQSPPREPLQPEESAVEQMEKTDEPEPRPESPPAKNEADELLEKALNCLLIEHSYCIPDAIFHSASAPDDEKHDDASVSSMTPHRHDDSTKSECCKSNTTTPRKRKHAKKTSSGGESSSSSSSDSDSSSSSCGSNCSCNRSNSACSSSSSAASDCSTTPEKKKKKKRERDEEEEKRTQQQREQMFLLDARESDLDTEISSAGEDFYEERPRFVPPPQPQPVVDPVPEPVHEVPAPEPMPNNRKSGSKSRKDKKKKKKRIKLNLTGRIPPNCNPLRQLQYGAAAQSAPNVEFTNPELLARQQIPTQQHYQHQQLYQQYMDEKPGTQSYVAGANLSAANCTPSSDGFGTPTGAGTTDDSNSRLSKRKRVKNKFYGYSSSDEANKELPATGKTVAKKRVLTKKPNTAPKNRQFIGIRAKLPPSAGKRLSVSIPFTPIQHVVTETPPVQPATLYRPPTQSAAPYNPYRSRYSSSEDSDSDEKRHTLVINLPNRKDRNNSYRPSSHYSDESMSSNSWVSSPRTEAPTQPAAAPRILHAQPQQMHGFQSSSGATNSPLKNSEKLYCYCRCPYDEVSEMIGCDAPNCKIEWFHFECVGIMVPPKGKWYCPSCRRNRENVSRFV